MSILIEEISQQHNRKLFDCGVTELNQFLQRQARQKTVKHISKSYVASQKPTPTVIMGYYTLTGYSVTTPPSQRDYKKYPHPLRSEDSIICESLAQDFCSYSRRSNRRIVSYATITTTQKTDKKTSQDSYITESSLLSAVKLARLAVDRSQQRQRLGERLLIDAICRTVLVAQQISAIGLFVDPMTPQVIPFYPLYGFLYDNPDDHSRLEMWLPIKTCIEIMTNCQTR